MAESIQSLWIGPRLSPMERVTIASFLRHGHPFHLYAYEEPDGVPPGTTLKDASQILPASRIFKYSGYNSYAGFSNFFRYRLLLEKGGWWVDADTVCLKPFDFSDAYVFSSEMYPMPPDGAYEPTVNNGVLKAPPNSQLIQDAWEFCDSIRVEDLTWGQCGPALVNRLVEKHSLQRYVRMPHVFCPLHCPEWDLQLWGGVRWDFTPETYAVHLWNEMWRRAGFDKFATWSPGCLYETLQRQFLGEPAAARGASIQ